MTGGSRMVKLNIFNIERFLNEVNTCGGPVELHSSDGTVIDIRKNPAAQNRLRQLHQTCGRCSSLTLDISRKADYMNLVLFSVGDY